MARVIMEVVVSIRMAINAKVVANPNGGGIVGRDGRKRVVLAGTYTRRLNAI